MTGVWGYLVLLLVSASLHQRVEAVSQRDVDRVFLTYNLDSDICKDITDSSPRDTKKNAHDACEQAFYALDRIKQNTCQNWRDARCRLISGQTYRQCSSLVFNYDNSYYISTPFRECAKNIAKEVPSKRVELTQSKKRLRSKHDNAQNSAKKRHVSINSKAYGGVGTSFDPYSSGRAGSSEGMPMGSSAGSSSGSQTAGSATSLSHPLDADEEGAPARLPCPHCPKSYVRLNTLREHLKCHNTNESKCPVCHRPFTLRYNLKVHMETAHPGVPMPEIARPPIKKRGPFICGECGRDYTQKKNLRCHEKSHQSSETYCFRCKMTFSSRGNYKRHLQNRHREDALVAEALLSLPAEGGDPALFPCPKCPRGYEHERTLQEHMKSHNTDETKCPVCHRTFTMKNNLRAHIKNSHPGTPLPEKNIHS